jgi:hypothetical protein
MVMDSGKMDSLRTQFQVPAPVSPSVAPEEPEVDASALDVFGGDEATASPTAEGDGFMALEDILGSTESVQEGKAAHDSFDPFAFDEKSSSLDEAPVAQEPMHESDPVLPEPVTSPRQSGVEAPQSAPKFIRSVPAMTTTPPKNPNLQVPQEVFDPFSEGDDASTHEDAPQQAFGFGDDLDSVFGDLPAMEEMPVVSTTPGGAPKIVRPGEIGAAHERVLVPPPAPSAQPIHIPSMTPAAAKETIQAPKEAEDMTEPRDRIFWKAESPLVGFLVTYDHDPKGSYVELRQGRLMVSNQRETSGSCLMVLGESISPMHAIMRVAPGGVVQVLDQLSEAGTRVKHIGQTEEEFLSGEKSTVSHGDMIFFGDRKFHVLLVIGEEDAES